MAEETKDETTISNVDIQKYLTGGEQTRITPEIQRLADTVVRGELLSECQQILHLINQLDNAVEPKIRSELMDARTTNEIIQSGISTGCTDKANVFASVARAVGIPTKVVETLDVSWLQAVDQRKITGHTYVQVFDLASKGWIWVDPVHRNVDTKQPADRVIVMEGIDGWSMGIKSIEDRRRTLQKFKNKWRKENLGT